MARPAVISIRFLAAVAVVVVSVLVVGMLLPDRAPRTGLEGGAKSTASPSPLRTTVIDDAEIGLEKMLWRTSPQDTQYLEEGRFRYAGSQCLRCELGPAVAAAALSSRTQDATLRHVALSVMDTALQAQLHPDGSWGPSTISKEGNGLDTMFFAEHLGMMMYALWPNLDEQYRAKYSLVLTRAADSLVAKRNNTFYVNGNINLGVTIVLGMAWHFTGAEKYHELYERSLDFVLDPGGAWSGFGLKMTVPATAPTPGHEGAGYLAEKGPNSPGYDPGYTQFQADLASQGYTVLRDARLLTLTKVLTNQLLRRVDVHSWSLDVSNGSRGTNPSLRAPFTTPALLVSALNGRPDRAESAIAQTEVTSALFARTADGSWGGMYQSWGTQIATILMWV